MTQATGFDHSAGPFKAGASPVRATRTWGGRAPGGWLRPVAGLVLPPARRLVTGRAHILLWVAGAVFGAYLLLPQMGELGQAVHALRSVKPPWLVAGFFCSLLGCLMAAWAQMGAVGQPLSLRHVYIVQMAAAFVSQLTPQGLGGMGLNERYLERAGVARPVAVGAVVLNMAAGAVVHVASLITVVLLVGSDGLGGLTLPIGKIALLAGLVMALLSGLVLATPVGRRRLVAPAATALRSMVAVLRCPVRAFQLFGGSAGVTAAYAVSLAICLQATGGEAALLQVAAVYLGAAAVGAAVPSPGGLGAMEAALVAGLTALGVAVGPAIAAVLIFRLLTFWLPILPGFVAFRYLRRRQLV